MKKISIILILLTFSTGTNFRVNAQNRKLPIYMLISGGIIVGSELVKITYNYINADKIEAERRTNEIKKQKELKKLLAPSKLYELLGKSMNTNVSISNIKETNITNKEEKSYYDQGVYLFNHGKKEEAKKMFIKCIEEEKEGEKALDFLIENYNLKPKEITKILKKRQRNEEKDK